MENHFKTLRENMSLEIYKEKEESIRLQYKVYDNRMDPRFGKTILYINKMNAIVCKISNKIPIALDRESQMFVNFSSTRIDLNHKNLVDVLHYYGKIETNYAGNFWMFYLMFEYPNNDLKLELRFRKIHGERFSVKELWKIAKGL